MHNLKTTSNMINLPLKHSTEQKKKIQRILCSTRKSTATFASHYQTRNDLPQWGQWVNGESYLMGASQDALHQIIS